MRNILTIIKNKKFFIPCVLLVCLYLLFFHNMWAYDLMDVDETRYIDMSRHMLRTKDFATLYLNGNYFFEKPPLYFWIESIVFAVFGKVSEGIGRIPIALEAIIGCLAVYFVALKAVSKKFALTVVCILATTLEFLILAKVAILDTLLTSCITVSVFSGFMTYFVQEKNKKYFWWLFYIFSALGMMAKGIPAFVVPFGTMFFVGLYAKNLREFFKPKYFLVGICLFLAIVLPWHVYMLLKYKGLFFGEYIMKHHIARFLGSGHLGKNRPFYYYFLVILWGFFPWIFSFVPAIAKKIKEFEFVSFDKLSNREKLVAFSVIGLLFTFSFFTASSSKLVTYILPIYPFFAVLLAEYWDKDGFSRGLKISSILLSSLILFVGIGGCFIKFYLPPFLFDIVKEVQIFTCIFFTIVGLLSFYFIWKNDKARLFATYVGFMILFSAFGAYHLFNIDYKFGQNDLKAFAQLAKKEDKNLASLNVGIKYSLNYYGDRNVLIYDGTDTSRIVPLLESNYYVVIRNKDMDIIKQSLAFDVIQSGVKYTLISKYSGK